MTRIQIRSKADVYKRPLAFTILSRRHSRFYFTSITK